MLALLTSQSRPDKARQNTHQSEQLQQSEGGLGGNTTGSFFTPVKRNNFQTKTSLSHLALKLV